MLYCVRLLRVRFSLKLRLKEDAYLKALVCNTKVGKSKPKLLKLHLVSILSRSPGAYEAAGSCVLCTSAMVCAAGHSEMLCVTFRPRQGCCLSGDSFSQQGWQDCCLPVYLSHFSGH